MNKYNRDNIKSDMIKAVIMRADFSGITDINLYVDRLKQSDIVNKAFDKMSTIRGESNSIDNFSAETDDITLPISEKPKSNLYHFHECNVVGPKDTYLDISENYICLQIFCDNDYSGSKGYSKVFAECINLLKDYDSYISINRIGIRKVDSVELNEESERNNYFNQNFIVGECIATRNESNSRNLNLANLTQVIKQNSISINIVQQVRPDKDKITAILDIDAFITGKTLHDNLGDKLESFIYNDMQDTMFEQFVNCMSETYLESHLKQQK